jgi:16S rRNA (guanine966-N2)-methyltransferase
MRIVAGAWRGRPLIAPPGQATRPTADRLRQALFDMLWHAPWAGRDVVVGARVLDAFAGTGALGLEALSRGAAFASFIEQDRAALAALRGNIAALGAGAASQVLAIDLLQVRQGKPCGLVFLDPPYRHGLISRAINRLQETGWVAPGTLVIAELARDEPAPQITAFDAPLAERSFGAARLAVWRHTK